MNKTIGEFEVSTNNDYKKFETALRRMVNYSLMSFLLSVTVSILSKYLFHNQTFTYVFIGIACISFVPLYLYASNNCSERLKIWSAFVNDEIIKVEVRESKKLEVGYMKAFLYYENVNKEVNYFDINVKLINKTDIDRKTLLLDKNILYIPFI